MIVRTQKVRFSPRRKPTPGYLRLGFEGDHLVERIEFELPVIDGQQTAALIRGGSEADAVMLEFDGGEYYIDLTRELIGACGEIEAHVRIDGAGGAVWQSGKLLLVTGDVSDADTDIEQRFPTAVEQMLAEMAEHRAEMAEQETRMEDALERAENAVGPCMDVEYEADSCTVLIETHGIDVEYDEATGTVTLGGE